MATTQTIKKIVQRMKQTYKTKEVKQTLDKHNAINNKHLGKCTAQTNAQTNANSWN